MMPFKEFINAKNLDEDVGHDLLPVTGMPPALLTLHRLSVHNYSSNIWVALYKSKQLDRFFTVLYR